MKQRGIWWALWPLALAWGSCQGAEERIVAKVGGRKISVQDYDRMAIKLLKVSHRELEGIDLEIRRELLEAMISKELLLREALVRGMDRIPRVAIELGQLEEKLWIKTFYDREVTGGIELREPEIERYFYERGFDEEIRLSHAMCATAEEAEQVLAELRLGASFEALVAERSIHLPSGRRGGDMGFMAKGDMLPEVRDAVLSLHPGQRYPKPVQSRYGFHVFRVEARRKVDFATNRDRVAQKLETEKRSARISASRDSLVRARELACDDTLLRRLAENPAGIARDERICHWEGGELSADEYRAAVRQSAEKMPTDEEVLRSWAEGMASRKILVAEAHRRGRHLDEEIQAQIQRRRDELIAAELYEEITGAVTVSEAEIQSFYDAHPAEYHMRPAVEVEEILAENRELAEELQRRIEAGEDMGELAEQYSLREATRKDRGHMQLSQRENPLLGPLAPAALDAELGVLHGPLEVPGGFSIFRVVQRKQLPARSFEGAHKGIEAILQAKAKNEELDRFLKELKTKYEHEIEIYPEGLTATLQDYEPDRDPRVVSVGKSL